VPVLGGSLHLELYRNFAGSGNRFTGHPVLVSLLALVAIVLLVGFARRVRTRGAALAAGLLLGGGISNLLDRLLRAPGPLRGGVVDWLKPTASGGSMNLADLAITLGVAVIVGGAIVGTLRARPTRGEAV
jgi:signal peptidase II